MLTPAAPNAGPTGGDGFAAPPLICNFNTLSTYFAIIIIFQIACNLIQEESFFQKS